MTVRVKCWLIFGALVSANIAVWGAKHLAYTLDPIVKALGA